MYLEKLGIFGWNEIEPVILSAVVANKSILFVGDHGANKTEACSLITKAVLGEEANFKHYEVPHLNFDDLLGYTNPQKLAKGVLEFVETPISIWGADAALFDEINKTNPFVQGKLHELIRTRKIMGMKTGLKLCFSAVNPPIKYQTTFMDIPLASRFCIVQVPSYASLDDGTKYAILNKSDKSDYKGSNLNKIIRKAKKAVKAIETKDINSIVLKLSIDLKDAGVNFSGRQSRDLKSLFVACKALSTCSKIKWNEDILARVTLSCIPEVNDIVRSDLEFQRISGIVNTVLQGFKFMNPLIIAEGLEELINIKTKDQDILDWINTVKSAFQSSDSVGHIKSAMKVLAKKTSIDKTTRKSLLTTAAKIIIYKENEDADVLNYIN